MDDDDRRMIEDALNDLAAQSRVNNALVLAVIGQVAGNSHDWRERLEIMRANVDTALISFGGGQPGDEMEPFRRQTQAMAQQRFDEMFAALKAREADMDPRLRPEGNPSGEA